MAGLVHAKVLTGADGTNPDRAQPSDWNDDHDVTGAIDFGAYAHKLDQLSESTGSAGITLNHLLDASAAGITFGDETMTTWDEGTFTPTFGFGTPGDESWTYGQQVGYYYRYGAIVHCTIWLSVSAMSYTTATGLLYVKGLPFTMVNSNRYGAVGCLLSRGVTGYGYCIMPVANTTTASLHNSGAGGIANVNQTIVTSGELPELRAEVFYETA